MLAALPVLALLLGGGPAEESAPRAPADATTGAGEETTPRAEELAAKRRAKAAALAPEKVTPGEQRILDREKRGSLVPILQHGFHGVRPLIGGMPSGAGWLVGGVGFAAAPLTDSFRAEVAARVSTNSWLQADARLDVPGPSVDRLVKGFVHGQWYDYKSVSFFGVGPDSIRTDPASNYRLTGGYARAGVAVGPWGPLRLEGEAGPLEAEVREGRHDQPQEDDGTPINPAPPVPRTRFAVYRGTARLDFRDSLYPGAGIVLVGELERFDETDGSASDFDRCAGEVQAHLPLGPRSRRIAFRLRTSAARGRDGGEVPYYLMEGLGGSRTLRGFRDLRFRDTRNLLGSVEYRWELHSFLDLALFADGGKVFQSKKDLDFNHLEYGYGIGARIHTPLSTIRFDVAHSHEETIRIHVSGGPKF